MICLQNLNRVKENKNYNLKYQSIDIDFSVEYSTLFYEYYHFHLHLLKKKIIIELENYIKFSNLSSI